MEPYNLIYGDPQTIINPGVNYEYKIYIANYALTGFGPCGTPRWPGDYFGDHLHFIIPCK